MAEKGDRNRLEPVAKQLFVDGRSLTEIGETLEVSRNTLDKWREWGGWDKAKAAKDNYELQLITVRDEIMQQITAAPLQAGGYLDALSKIEAILDRRAKSTREATDAIARQRSDMFLQFIRDLIEYGSRHDADLTRALQDNFDEIIQWGREKYAE